MTCRTNHYVTVYADKTPDEAYWCEPVMCDCVEKKIASLEAKLAVFERAIGSWKKEEAIWNDENATLRSERDAAVAEAERLRAELANIRCQKWDALQCEDCGGNGFQPVVGDEIHLTDQPCPSCRGRGIMDCEPSEDFAIPFEPCPPCRERARAARAETKERG